MLTIDLNAPPDQSSSDDDLWTLQPGETFQYEWSNIKTECDQVVEWYEEDSDCEEDVTTAPIEHRVGKLKVLKNHERDRVATTLLAQSHNCTKLPHGIINKLATKWGVSRHTIQIIWRETLKQYRAGSAIDLHTKKAGRVGRKRYTLQTSQLTEVPLRRRTTLRSLAGALNISKSTVHRMVKRGEIKSHSNPMKPQLTFTHKYERAKGGNNYRISHMSKERLERQGLLSNGVEIPHQLVHDSMYWLRHGYLEDDGYRLTLNRRQKQQATTSTLQHPQNSQE
ncbi:Replication initiation protein [Bienertia sinuspersici]